MSSFLSPDLVSFHVEGGNAVLSVAAAQPASFPTDWRALVRQTLIVLGGPGDEGYLIIKGAAPPAWDDALTPGHLLVRFTNGETQMVPLVD